MIVVGLFIMGECDRLMSDAIVLINERLGFSDAKGDSELI
jgi:hypothetical protein